MELDRRTNGGEDEYVEGREERTPSPTAPSDSSEVFCRTEVVAITPRRKALTLATSEPLLAHRSDIP